MPGRQLTMLTFREQRQCQTKEERDKTTDDETLYDVRSVDNSDPERDEHHARKPHKNEAGDLEYGE